MEVDDDDEVVAEYPLYAASIKSIYSQSEDLRLVQLQYPMRPPWRGYDLEHVENVSYKPRHHLLSMKLPEDKPNGVRFCPTSQATWRGCMKPSIALSSVESD